MYTIINGVLKMDTERIIKNTLNKIEEQPTGTKKLEKLLAAGIMTDEIKTSIYILFKTDIDFLIDDFVSSSLDPNARGGMFKCSLESWQACINTIGMFYFRKNNYLRAKDGRGGAYDGALLEIALNLYENYCYLFRKQFFIYDFTRFCGISRDDLYKLSSLYADILKKAHTIQEASMRTALASGRSNVTAMAILLNHDYDYTRTTQVIHTTEQIKSADTLPCLNDEKTLKISYQNQGKTQNPSEMM